MHHHIDVLRVTVFANSPNTFFIEMSIILASIIICAVWGMSISYGPITEKEYEKWCSDSFIYISFVSSMPYSLENYSKSTMNSFLFIKNESNIWRLFKLNSRDQKDWDVTKWKADENEIQISNIEGLEEAIKKLPDILPENLPPDEKAYILSKIETLFETKSESWRQFKY